MADDFKNKLVKWGRAIPRAIVPHEEGEGSVPAQFRPAPTGGKPKQVTMAAMIYAIGAGVLFVFALYNMMQGSWFNGIVIIIPAGSLLTLAYKYLQ